MDTRSGEIISPEEAERRMRELGRAFEKNFIEVDEVEMTPKQKKTKQVSKHDNKSKLGKKFASARYQRNYNYRNQNR